MRPSRLRAPLSFSFSLLFALLSASRADAQATQIKPRFLIVVDSSGSMNDAAPPNSCGYTATKMGAARCAIKNILNSFGDAEFGFMQFAQTNEATTSCAGGSCGQTAASSELLQGISGTNTATLLTYVDNAGDPEFCGDGYTPLGGTLAGAYAYFTGASSPTDTDAAVACRPYSVILLTDGVECCNSCASGGCPNAITESTARTKLAPSNPD